jgi:pyrroloquinoline-quinone synthase
MPTTLHPDQVHDALGRALEGRRLLEHPFYQRWEAGELRPGELAAYAEQYRHIEQALPAVLATVVDGLPDGAARDLVAANLADERSVPEPHTALFEGFAAAAGAAPAAAPTPATAALVGLERSTAGADPLAALCMVAAYEVQAAAIATTKSAGLSEHYGLDRAGTRFWDVHAAMEAEHADWSVDALALLATVGDDLETPARAAAEAWWAFLDEREALAPALA